MKVIFDHALPFQFAHGGVQSQILHTKSGLARAGVQVEFLRWWDEHQTADVVHLWGAFRAEYVQVARQKGRLVVMTSMFSEACNRPRWRLRLQGLIVRASLRLPVGKGIQRQLHWSAYRGCSHNIVGLAAERAVLQTVYAVPAEDITAVPLGVSEAFLRAGTGRRDAKHLICVGTIAPVKGTVALARMAHEAGVPIRFVGKPFNLKDQYWHDFQALLASPCVDHVSHVDSETDMIRLLHDARGFVLRSRFENWSLAASEAAACGIPLLLPDLPWARERFGSAASYFGRHGRGDHQRLRRFYQECPSLPPPAVNLPSWLESAQALRRVYEKVWAAQRS